MRRYLPFLLAAALLVAGCATDKVATKYHAATNEIVATTLVCFTSTPPASIVAQLEHAGGVPQSETRFSIQSLNAESRAAIDAALNAGAVLQPAATRSGVAAIDPALLRTGDILLYAPGDMPGYLISIKTGRLKSHVEGYIGGGQSIGARIEGINIYPVRLDAKLASVRRHANWQTFNLDKAMAAVQPEIGSKYDVGGLFSFFNPWRVPDRAIRVCSPLAARWERGGGCEPFNPDLPSNGVTPAGFFETGGLQTIWRNPAIDRAAFSNN